MFCMEFALGKSEEYPDQVIYTIQPMIYAIQIHKKQMSGAKV